MKDAADGHIPKKGTVDIGWHHKKTSFWHCKMCDSDEIYISMSCIPM